MAFEIVNSKCCPVKWLYCLNKVTHLNEIMMMIHIPWDLTLGFLVQAICSAVSLLASVPLGELFFFHMILIKKVSLQNFFLLLLFSLKPFFQWSELLLGMCSQQFIVSGKFKEKKKQTFGISWNNDRKNSWKGWWEPSVLLKSAHCCDHEVAGSIHVT